MAMTVTCPSCSTSFPVDPAKIPVGGVKARCSSCQGIIDVQPPAPEAEVVSETPAAPDTLAAPAPVEAPAEPAPAMEAVADAAPIIGEPEPAPVFTPPTDVSEPDGFEVTGDVTPLDLPLDEPEPAVVADAPAEDSGTTQAPATVETPPAAPVQFGRRTPEDKAKSLARSLVSDIVAYYTEKHESAMAAGTLLQEFEEEVEKCMKEYQEQVDAGVVQNNTFLNDALNDILAGGQPVFNVSA